MNLHISNQELEKKDLKAKLIEDHVTAQDEESKIVLSDLLYQSESLKKRLELRRKLKNVTKEESKTTTSSTPNLQLSSQKEKLKGNIDLNKSNSSESNSVDQNSLCNINFEHLEDQKFSEELMNRLKLLQEGYDEDEFDDDFFDDEDVIDTNAQIYEECISILHKNDEEQDKVMEENTKEIELLYEELANQKFEKIAEVKAEFKFKIKFVSGEAEIKELEKERDLAISKLESEFNKIKVKRITEIKQKHKENQDKTKHK